MRQSVYSTLFLLLAATLGSALTPPTKSTLWGKPLGKRQVQPSSLPNDCVYTCDQFAQQLKGMCAVTTSHCQSVQAALDATSDDHGCDVWSTACEQLATEYAQDCAATPDGCVTCSAATTDANNLCTQSAIACLGDSSTSSAMDTQQCYAAKAVCDWELSLLARVMPCGTADCAAPCYALIGFQSMAAVLLELCEAGSSNCYNGYTAGYNDITAVAYSCSRDPGYVECGAVGIWTRSCSYITGAIQDSLALAVTTCQQGFTVGSAAYEACASAYSYTSDYVQEYVSSVGC